MSAIQLQVIEALRSIANRLRKAGLPNDIVAQVDDLREQVQQPCVVAVVGRVKAGKSTFVNALLGEDLAKVGIEETTATINYFRYGIPRLGFPVRCYWRSGKVTDESRKFLNDLQGNDYETLRRADGIEHLEYHIQNPYLEEITLVDTPGTGTVIDKHHDRTSEFLSLYTQLRERHDRETESIGSKADAVIYLLGATARMTDQAILAEFQQTTQDETRSLNAIGVLAKIDLDPAIVKRRVELTQKMTAQLQDSLNTVLPVSASLQWALTSLVEDEQAGLKRLITALCSIPPDDQDFLLSSPKIFLEEEWPEDAKKECKELLNTMPWRVFTTIAQVINNPTFSDEAAIVQELREIAGFERLNIVLNQHFVQRGQLLRCYRIINDARKILDEVKYNYLPTFRDIERDRQNKLERFKNLLQRIRGPIARELEMFIAEQLAPRADLRMILEEAEREIGIIQEDLEGHNSDFEALQQIEVERDLFKEERDELRLIFGLHGLEIEDRLPPEHANGVYIKQRLRYWDQKSRTGRNQVARDVAAQAARRYNLVAMELLARNGHN